MSGTKTGWTSKDGTKLYAKYWAPDGNAKAVVCLVHGLGEHCERYDHVAEMLNSNGMGLYGFDHRGHGRSEGKRGFIPDYEVLMEEIDLLLQHAREQFPDVPVFLYGHSWGGNAVANYLIRRQPDVQGALITGPWLRLTNPPSAFMAAMARFINNIFPSLQQSNGLSSSDLSHNTDVVKAYDDDPLVHGKVTPRLFVTTSEAGEYAIANAAKVKVPVLLMHGTADNITSPAGTQAFYENLGARKALKMYEGMYHEVHNEVENSLVLADMLQFFTQYL
jgi:alpha-beta hydrolase superfamily lysophospholipase